MSFDIQGHYPMACSCLGHVHVLLSKAWLVLVLVNPFCTWSNTCLAAWSMVKHPPSMSSATAHRPRFDPCLEKMENDRSHCFFLISRFGVISGVCIEVRRVILAPAREECRSQAASKTLIFVAKRARLAKFAKSCF